MTTIKKKKAADRRAEIIAAAQHILAHEGPSALTLRAVAGAVGIKLASLQYYFPTYATLLEGLADATVAYYSAALEADDDTGATPEKRLNQALNWFSTQPAPDSEIAKLELQFWALAQTNADAKAALQRYHAAYLSYFEDLIGAARPALSPAHVSTKALAIAALFEGAVLFVDLLDAPEDRTARAHDILNTAKAILDLG